MIKIATLMLAAVGLCPSAVWSMGRSSSPIQAEVNPQGMPRCVYPLDAHGGYGLLLRWNEAEVYHRDIEFARIEDLAAQANPTLQASFDFWDCRNWEEVAKRGDLRWQKLPEHVSSVAGYDLPSSVLDALAQVRIGGTELRYERTASEYLRAHPISQYDRQLNRDFTHRFGMGFASEIFEAWTVNRPANRDLLSDLHRHLNHPETPAVFKSQFKDRTVIIANGIGNTPNGGRLKHIFEDFEAFGLDTSVFNTGPYVTVEVNSDQILLQLEDALGRGQKVILLGASKSYPEILKAITRVRDPSGIQAVIALSGLTDGSFLADRLCDGALYPVWRSAARLLRKMIPQHPDFLKFDVFRSVTTANLQHLFSEAAPKLPKNILYVNLLGIMGGDGLSSEPSIRKIQDTVIRRYSLNAGANDGYVEYPGNQVPDAWGLKSYALVIHGSHLLTDGSFENYSFANTASRQQFFQALFETLDERGASLAQASHN